MSPRIFCQVQGSSRHLQQTSQRPLYMMTARRSDGLQDNPSPITSHHHHHHHHHHLSGPLQTAANAMLKQDCLQLGLVLIKQEAPLP